MNHYEVTFIVNPVLSGDEIKSTAQTYADLLVDGGCNIVGQDYIGLLQLAIPINKRSTGVYYSTEFQAENGNIIPRMELAMKRDERIMRYLTIALDKYGVKYNQDKRDGKIGKVEPNAKKAEKKAPVATSEAKAEEE